HQKLREVYREKRIGMPQQTDLRQRFIQYGRDWYTNRSQPLPDYLRQFWVTHLVQAQEWTTLRQGLTEIVPPRDGDWYIQPWANARFVAEGSYAGYLADQDVLWHWVECEDGQYVGLQVRCALINGSVRSLLSSLPAELIAQLVGANIWNPAVALAHISQLAN